MQDVKKVNVKNSKRSRKKNAMLKYYILIAFFIICIGFSLCVTFLFNINNIAIGRWQESKYSREEIAEASGISGGDNLIRLNTEKVRENILNTLEFVDDAEVVKSFPNGVIINITPSINAAYVECKGGYMLISEGWRILGLFDKTDDDNIIIVKGFDPQSNVEKTVMTSNDNDKNEALKVILDEIKKQNIQKIKYIDLTDKYDIVINYDNRILIKIEKADDIEYKLRFAYQIVKDELKETKSGYLIYRNSLGFSYVSTEEYEKINGLSSEINSDTDSETETSE